MTAVAYLNLGGRLVEPLACSKREPCDDMTGALKDAPVGQSDRRKHAVRDGIDADRVSPNSRRRPAVAV